MLTRDKHKRSLHTSNVAFVVATSPESLLYDVPYRVHHIGVGVFISITLSFRATRSLSRTFLYSLFICYYVFALTATSYGQLNKAATDKATVLLSL